jgi:predicted metalloprotease
VTTTRIRPQAPPRRRWRRWRRHTRAVLCALPLIASFPSLEHGRANVKPKDVAVVFVPALNAYWRAQFNQWGASYRSPRIRWYTRTPIPIPRSCDDDGRRDGRLRAARATYTIATWRRLGDSAYCPGNATIYLDLGFHRFLIQHSNPTFSGLVLAHEWSHHVQALTYQYVPSLHAELQADCYAGAFFGYATQVGLFNSDMPRWASYFLLLMGDDPTPWWDAKLAHGTGEQRRTAFGSGFYYGACD